MPSDKRNAIYAAYAFCRYCDDAVDQELDTDSKLTKLQDLRLQLESATQGSPEGPMFTALAHAANVYNIPSQYFDEVINGVEMDLTKSRYQTFEELQLYCYRVASVVGLICIQIFGYKSPVAKQHAINLGLAMQLTNIIRDVREDLDRGRIYLPLDELSQYGCTEQNLATEIPNQSTRNLMAFQVERARMYFQRGGKLFPYLSPRSRACPAVLSQLYIRILDHVEANSFNVFDGRISLSKNEKLLVTATTWLKSFLPQKIPI